MGSSRTPPVLFYSLAITTWPTYLTRPNLRPLRREFRSADRAWCKLIRSGTARLSAFASGQAEQFSLGYARTLSGALNRARRKFALALRALRQGDVEDAKARAKRRLLSDRQARERVIGELGGEMALRRWESRWARHKAQQTELAKLMRGGLSPEDARAALEKRLREAAPMPRELPPFSRAQQLGETPSVENGCIRERIVNPCVALRLVADGSRRRRDFTGRFALPPIPPVISLPRGAAQTRLTIERRHGITIHDIREQLKADRAMERARREADPRGHLDPQSSAPIYVTPDELRRGWAAHDEVEVAAPVEGRIAQHTTLTREHRREPVHLPP